ncbi:unnamed protein product [Amoebophrya sp. A25]|nr:unnamed protein product [Amoebophrya sp. A25]|eukprot:GSA25T00009906001.1
MTPASINKRYAFIDSDASGIDVFLDVHPGARRHELYSFFCTPEGKELVYVPTSHLQLGSLYSTPVRRLPCVWKHGAAARRDLDVDTASSGENEGRTNDAKSDGTAGDGDAMNPKREARRGMEGAVVASTHQDHVDDRGKSEKRKTENDEQGARQKKAAKNTSEARATSTVSRGETTDSINKERKSSPMKNMPALVSQDKKQDSSTTQTLVDGHAAFASWLLGAFGDADELIVRIGVQDRNFFELVRRYMAESDRRQKLYLDGLATDQGAPRQGPRIKKVYVTEGHVLAEEPSMSGQQTYHGGAGVSHYTLGGRGAALSAETASSSTLDSKALLANALPGPLGTGSSPSKNNNPRNIASRQDASPLEVPDASLLGDNKVLVWPLGGNPADMWQVNTFESADRNLPVLRSCMPRAEAQREQALIAIKVSMELAPAADFVQRWRALIGPIERLSDVVLQGTNVGGERSSKPNEIASSEQQLLSDNYNKESNKGTLTAFVFSEFVEQFPKVVRSWQTQGVSVQARCCRGTTRLVQNGEKGESSAALEKDILERGFVKAFRTFRNFLDPVPKFLLAEGDVVPPLMKFTANRLGWQIVQPSLVLPPEIIVAPPSDTASVQQRDNSGDLQRPLPGDFDGPLAFGDNTKWDAAWAGGGSVPVGDLSEDALETPVLSENTQSLGGPGSGSTQPRTYFSGPYAAPQFQNAAQSDMTLGVQQPIAPPAAPALTAPLSSDGSPATTSFNPSWYGSLWPTTSARLGDAEARIAQLLEDPLEYVIRRPVSEARQDGGILVFEPYFMYEVIEPFFDEARFAGVHLAALSDCA